MKLDVLHVNPEDVWWDGNDLIVGEWRYVDAVIHGIRIEGDYE